MSKSQWHTSVCLLLPHTLSDLSTYYSLLHSLLSSHPALGFVVSAADTLTLCTLSECLRGLIPDSTQGFAPVSPFQWNFPYPFFNISNSVSLLILLLILFLPVFLLQDLRLSSTLCVLLINVFIIDGQPLIVRIQISPKQDFFPTNVFQRSTKVPEMHSLNESLN